TQRMALAVGLRLRRRQLHQLLRFSDVRAGLLRYSQWLFLWAHEVFCLSAVRGLVRGRGVSRVRLSAVERTIGATWSAGLRGLAGRACGGRNCGAGGSAFSRQAARAGARPRSSYDGPGRNAADVLLVRFQSRLGAIVRKRGG